MRILLILNAVLLLAPSSAAQRLRELNLMPCRPLFNLELEHCD